MNPGIFISYSREDQKQALHLLSLLRAEGYNVWIDQEAIPGASIWSDEIVQNIKACDIFLALLSESSVQSPNVSREIGLAAEHGKTILPIEIGKFELPGRLEYALAGIQKTEYHNEEAIIHALRKIAAKGESAETAPKKHRLSRRKRNRLRAAVAMIIILLVAGGFFFKSRTSSEKEIQSNMVVILPFSTMNLDQDSIRNLDIFSDGLVKRLSPLTNIVSAGPSISSKYKDSPLNSLAIAQELQARYIVEGFVRKKSDVDFISVRIFDLKKGGEIWEQFYHGNIRELFDIREKVCGDVYDRLREAVGNEQELQVLEKNALDHPNDALANGTYANKLIGVDNIRALEFFQRAIKNDSTNESYDIRAGIVADRIKDGGLARQFGTLGAAIARKKLHLFPDSLDLATTLCIALDVAGQMELSENLYDSLMPLYPKNTRLYFNAACNLARQGKAEKAVDVLEKLSRFAPGKIGETQSDPDFDKIRSYPQYVKLMAGWGNP